jgi:hypothetical protein
MIFNSSDDIKKDIKNRIYEYLKDILNQNLKVDTNNIISLLRSYLYELQIRKEIINSNIEDDKKNYMITIEYIFNDKMEKIIIDLYSEIRKIKIDKIQNHNLSEKDIKKFVLFNII